MSLPAAFWDSSALIPLCVQQPQTAQARALYNRFEVVVWWATPAEIISGLTRLQRMGDLGRDPYLIGKQRAAVLGDEWRSVRPSAGILAKALELLETYPLRAADALQLSAALAWCEGRAKGNVFLTFDERLREAAMTVGFTVE